MNSEIIEKAIQGGNQAQAEIITYLESGGDPGLVFGSRYEKVGKAHRIGITGPPGAGKSTIVSKLIGEVRRTIGFCAVIACDPTSPYTQGALLGDRARMSEHFTDPGVFIRSMATRGNLGGLAPTASIVADFLDICSYKVIIIETVGVGQTEVDVVSKTDTVVVIMTPESGDSIQMMKAGLLEGADIFCINKFDRPGGEALEADLQFGLSLMSRSWVPPIVRTVAKENIGIAELTKKINEHFDHLISTGTREKRMLDRYTSEVDYWVMGKVFDKSFENNKRKYIDGGFTRFRPPWEVAQDIWLERKVFQCQ